MAEQEYKLGDYVVYDGVVYKIHSDWNDGQKFDLIRVHPYVPEIAVRGATPQNIKPWDGTCKNILT